MFLDPVTTDLERVRYEFLYLYQTPSFQSEGLEDDIVYTSSNRGLCASFPGAEEGAKG